MSQKALPILFINLSGEMMYILDQRLKAQNICMEKSVKVMNDIVLTMFNENFIKELFKPQDLYSKKALRTVFEKLAHSSIMRLNGTSMEKLYDLMTMVFKYQLCLCARPEDILFITLNHLDGIREYSRGTDAVLKLVDNVYSLIFEHYSQLSSGQYHRLRYTLLAFFQDLEIRVSVLLKEGHQRPNGRFVLPLGGPVPYGFNVPGLIRIYGEDGKVIQETTFPLEHVYEPAKPLGSLEKEGYRGIILGTNVYLEQYSSESKSVKSVDQNLTESECQASLKQSRSACEELSLLARLIGQNEVKDQMPEFILGFHGEEDEDLISTSKQDDDNSNVPRNNVINIDVTQRLEQNALHKILGDLTVEEKQEPDVSDILDLLDVASA